jgi:tripartite ATP-independent transporter DctP family solute receptor
MMVGMLSACGDGAAAPGSSAAASGSGGAAYVWKCALNSTEGDNAYDTAAVFADKVSELTNGRVQVDLYGGASLGSTTEVLEGMSAGVADIICESVGTLAPFTDLANIDAMPYLFSGYDHFMDVWSGSLGEEMRTTIGEAAGFKLLGATYRGARIVTATKKMETVDDFKGFKLRTPSLDVYVKTWQWMGASPTPMAMNEVYTALQQGTVEGQENPMVDDLNYSFDEVCKYWIKTNHVYSCNLMMMDLNYFNSLPEDIQAAVKEAAEYAGQQISQAQADKDAAAEQTLTDEGCEIVEVDNAAFARYFDGFAEQNYPNLADWVNQIRAMDPAR